MKHLFSILLIFAMATTIHAQKKMVRIDMPVAVAQIPVEGDTVNIETIVNVRFTTDDIAILITRNGMTTFKVNHDNEFVDGDQYTVFLQIQEGDTRDVIPAVLLAKSRSVRQIYSDIASMRKTFIKPEK